ncbi:unnamed protein product [Bursaphelenchus xylophilus]|uniref:(pine wood nematode) hypothetical protein n=1 Tax=Bursaphelenchus xylophilus TaxID=6326 RepID=A0A1I7RPB3_BURXY|nr:unnamed protein product [Bursaphelenchus xylophilus]CAG9095727.1 unnamed protein product [Bursaphelenchus xylophilus]
MALRLLTLKILGIRTAQMAEISPEEEYKRQKIQDRSNRYSGVPSIPADIGFGASKSTGGEAQKGGIVSHVAGNPFVIAGMGLTCVALLGMMRRSFLGDRLGAQKYMQYRIMAQFFTVTALVAGVAVFGMTYEPTNKKI